MPGIRTNNVAISYSITHSLLILALKTVDWSFLDTKLHSYMVFVNLNLSDNSIAT